MDADRLPAGWLDFTREAADDGASADSISAAGDAVLQAADEAGLGAPVAYGNEFDGITMRWTKGAVSVELDVLCNGRIVWSWYDTEQHKFDGIADDKATERIPPDAIAYMRALSETEAT